MWVVIVANPDVVIIGAGILGLATAYHIKRMRPRDEVLVVDMLSGPGQGNTAKSAAMFRSFFSSKTNLTLADTSIEFYKHVQEEYNLDFKMRWVGYLFLLNENDYKRNKEILEEMDRRGLKYVVYDSDYLSKNLNLNTKVSEDEEARLMGLLDVDVGLFVPKAGSIDVDLVVKFYEREFLKLGGKAQYNTKVKRILIEPRNPLGIPGEPYVWQDARASGVETDKGVIKAGKVVVAAGAWVSSLLDPLGVDCHVKPKKRQIFSVKADKEELKKLLWCKAFNPEGCMPFIILPKPHIYIRPAVEEEAFWLGCADEFGRAFKLEDEPLPEENFYKYGIYQVVVKYFPQFEGCSPYSSWAGLYAINTIDEQPIVFEENDIIVVSGASGSGVMKADALGRIAAALYAEEEYAELYGGVKFKVSDLGIKERKVEPERLVL